MKNWMRTPWGKAALFVLCIVSVAVTVLSVYGSMVAIDGGVYTEPKEETFKSMVAHRLQSEAEWILWGTFSEQGVYEPNSNLVFKVTDPTGKVIAVKEAEATVCPVTYNVAVAKDPTGRITEIHICYGEPERADQQLYQVQIGFQKGFPEQDYYQWAYGLINLAYYLRYSIYMIAFAALLLALFSFIGLMGASGRQPHSDDLHPGVLNRVPFDLLLGVNLLAGGVVCGLMGELLGYSDVLVVTGIILTGIFLAVLLLGLCMSVAARIKQRNLWRNTLVWKILRGLGRLLRGFWRGALALFRGLPLVWRTCFLLFTVSVAELFVVCMAWYETDVLLVWWFLEKAVLIPLVLWGAVTLRKLQKGGDALAGGDLQYRTDTGGMFWDFKRHGENLNSIGRGMNLAVERQLKSERLKTELITNVSHDIKTPLTSIINYAGLIEREPCENGKVREYADVLHRQAERLKRLLEDLLEASKASTGNLEVHPEPCDAGIFLSQAAGEYEDRLAQKDLQLITHRPESSLSIMADGRRMWRIFDNLMLNICKYAQPGTRVYLSLEQLGNRAVFTFKNTSREALNISEEELMERFTRGDASRNTEGNGLGLSIARSLAELQGGYLHLSIDGDLFKAILSFPLL